RAMWLKNTNGEFEDKKFRDIFKKDPNDPVPKNIDQLHYIFIFLSGMALQFLDISSQNIKIIMSDNEFKLGLLNAFFVLAVFCIMKIRSKKIMPQSYWYYGMSITFILVLLSNILFDYRVTQY